MSWACIIDSIDAMSGRNRQKKSTPKLNSLFWIFLFFFSFSKTFTVPFQAPEFATNWSDSTVIVQYDYTGIMTALFIYTGESNKSILPHLYFAS